MHHVKKKTNLPTYIEAQENTSQKKLFSTLHGIKPQVAANPSPYIHELFCRVVNKGVVIRRFYPDISKFHRIVVILKKYRPSHGFFL
jgi:hypothetical protein